MDKTNQRSDWVDYAKGIGIILVVYGHLLSSAYHAGIQIPEHFFALSDSIVYSFHMPLFFFLSGLLVESSLQKRGTRDYLIDKFARIAYPYFIWSILQVSVEVVFSSQTQQGATISDLFAIPYQPWGQFWFLYALLIMHVAYSVLRGIGRFSTVLMLAVGFGLFFFPLKTGMYALFGFSVHFIFFLSGALLKKYLVNLEKHNVPLWSIFILFIALLGSGYYIFENAIKPVRLMGTPYTFHYMFLSILGITACISLSIYLARRNVIKPLKTLGMYSLQIYLAHMLAGVGMRMILLNVFQLQNWVIHIGMGVFVALIAPIILQNISIRINFPYLFELKGRQSMNSN